MKIPVCHHFWKDGEYAVWQPARFPVPEIENKVKADYDLLQDEQPPYKEYGNYTVFFAYKPGKDIFGRKITAISFAFVKNCASPQEFETLVLPQLKNTPFNAHNLSIRINLLEWRKWKNFIKKPLSIISAMLIISFIICYVLLQNRYNKIEEIKPNEPIRHIVSNDSQTEGEKTKILPESAEMTIAPICAILSKLELYPCPQSYLEYYCGPWPEVNKKFKDWFEDAPECRQARRNLFSPNMPVFRKIPDPEQEKYVRKILFKNLPRR